MKSPQFVTLLLSGLLLANATGFATQINSERQSLEKSLETRIEHEVKTFLGGDAKVLAFVHVNEAAPAGNAKAEAPSRETFYADVPLVYDEKDGSVESSLDVESVDVEVEIPDEFEASVQPKIQEFISKSLKDFNPRVVVNRFKAPDRIATAKPNPAQSAEPPLTFRMLLPFLTALAIGLAITLGIIVIALSLRATGRTLVDGLRQVFNLNHINAGTLGSGSAATQTLEIKERERSNAHASAQKDYPRNLKLIKRIIKESPTLFAQSIRNDEADLRGIKYILPDFSTEEQEAVRTLLGEDRLRLFSKIEDSSEPGSEDSMTWLQNFAERLVVRKIQGGSPVERILGSERCIALSTIPPKRFLELVKSSGDPAAWRIAAEYVPGNQLEQLAQELGDSSIWQNLIQAAEINADSLKTTADQIISELQHAPGEQIPEDTKSEYFSNKLLNLAISSMGRKELDAEDTFLDQIEGLAPELAHLVRDKVWTPRNLLEVPRPYLNQAFRSLDTDQKVSLIIGLPQKYSELIMSLMPKGNIRTIVTDQVKRVRARDKASDLQAAEAVCRQFLATLKKACDENKFERQDPATQESVQAPEPDLLKAA